VLSQDQHFDPILTLAPGRLGENEWMTAGGFSLAMLFGLLIANRYDHSSKCTRCGHRICTRCEETVWSEEICEDCHHLFQNPTLTDPSLRMARLQALSKRSVGIDRIVLAGSLLIPGVAGLASRRPDYAMLGLLSFGWIAAWIAWPLGVFDDPILMGDAAMLCFAIPGVLAVLSYGGIVAASMVARKNL
jgi:ribosomal protein L37AE/L43A